MNIFRKLITMVAAAVLVSSGAASGAPIAKDLPAGPTPGGFTSDNVEWVAHMPFDIDTSGARLIGKFFYITNSRGLTIYDVSDPLSPQLQGVLPLPQEPYFAEEDVDSNGNVLLISTIDSLYVIDVEDKASPQIIGELAGAEQHTWSCLLDCRWAYGSGGMIADLRDPTAPKEAGEWGKGLPASSGHDVTEVKPGFVVTSTQPVMLLDVRKDPTKPKLLAVGANSDNRFIHSNLWPNQMKERYLLVGGETSGPACDDADDGKFMTWDTEGWAKTHTLTLVDEYQVTNGLPTEGNAPANLFCTHWFDTHPKYRHGGLVAMAWYEHGTRLFDIDKKGKISEAGYFVPFAGSTSAAYWVTNEILYTADYNRGIDILRVAP
jgi:hypothetical protein